MYAALAITAAIAHRERAGEGQYIDVALLDTIVASGRIRSSTISPLARCRALRQRARQPASVRGVPTADGHVILAVGNDAQWTSFCKAAEHPELAYDARFLTMPDRIRNRTGLIPLVREIMKRRASKDWIERLEAANVPCARSTTTRGLRESAGAAPWDEDRNAAPALGTLPGIASPMRFSETPVEYTVPPPRLASIRVSAGSLLGLGNGELDRLAAQKII